jgi:hypothetical protein
MKKTILLIGPLPKPPITGGIAIGIQMMLNSKLSEKYDFILLNRAKQHGSKESVGSRIRQQCGMIMRLLYVISKR